MGARLESRLHASLFAEESQTRTTSSNAFKTEMTRVGIVPVHVYPTYRRSQPLFGRSHVYPAFEIWSYSVPRVGGLLLGERASQALTDVIGRTECR